MFVRRSGNAVIVNTPAKINRFSERLAEVAVELGSDVPFFLHTGTLGSGAAVCRGRGERVEPALGLARLNYVIARPPEGLATPLVFKHCRPANTPARSAGLLAAAR